jgi:hypothetical protein
MIQGGEFHMRFYTLLSASLFALSVPAVAAAQDCASELQKTAEQVSSLPSTVPYQVNDQLQLDYDEASSLVDADPAGCMAIVRKMNETIRRYGAMGSAGGDGSGSGGSSSSGGDQGEDGPTRVADRAEDLTDFDSEERRRARLREASYNEAENIKKVLAYVDAMKDYGAAIRAAGEAAEIEPAVISATVKPAEDSIKIANQMQQDIIVNDDVDVLHAKLEDAIRRLDELEKIKKREFDKFRAMAKEVGEEAPVEAPREGTDDDLLAPLVPPKKVITKDQVLAQLMKAMAALERSRKANWNIRQIRNKLDGLIHEYTPFYDMRPGYKDAYRSAYETHKSENDAVRRKCDSVDFPFEQCVSLINRTNENAEKRLDGIFNSYVIRQQPD